MAHHILTLISQHPLISRLRVLVATATVMATLAIGVGCNDNVDSDSADTGIIDENTDQTAEVGATDVPDGGLVGRNPSKDASSVDTRSFNGSVAPVGSACATNSDCANGQCVDNVCCAASVCGTCSACELNSGTCKPVAVGKADPGTCESGRACDGAGACKQGSAIGCVDDAQCASGFCIDGVCCNSACRGTCETCGGDAKGQCLPLQSGQDTNATPTCSGDFSCFADPAKATASVCKLPDGKTCGAASQCLSGACTKFFVDDDRDGFGSGTKAQRSLCGTTAPAGLSIKVGDCNDSQAQVYPGQTQFFQTPIPGTQGYDYNCDNAQESEHPSVVFWRSGGFDSSNTIPECGGFRLREWEVQCNNRDECTSQCSVPNDRCVFPCVGCSNISGCDSQECNLGCERSGLCFFSPLNVIVYQPCR